MPDEDELTETERRALDALPDEAPLPPGYEDRVVAALRAGGLLAASPAAVRPRRQLVRLGLAAGLFGSGLGAGWLAARADHAGVAPGGGPLYLLLLYAGPDDVAGEPARVAEYAAWASRLRRAGRLVGAERLRNHGLLLLGGSSEAAWDSGPQGFFLVRAQSDAEAETIARDCPHLRHGGRVAVQAVDPT
jgi:YCII-related domain